MFVMYRRFITHYDQWYYWFRRKLTLRNRLCWLAVWMIFVLFAGYLPSFLRWPMLLIVAIPYQRTIRSLRRQSKSLRRRIQQCNYIGINTKDEDIRARQRLWKRRLRVLAAYLLVGFTAAEWGLGAGSVGETSLRVPSTLLLATVLGVLFFSWKFIAVKRPAVLVFLLTLTSSFTVLFILSFIINVVDPTFINSVHPRTLYGIFQKGVDTFAFVFVGSGTDPQFQLTMFGLSFLFQIIFVLKQPAYRLEKSRLALETIAVLFGAISAVGLLKSAEISRSLFDYLRGQWGFGRDLLISSNITSEAEFKTFFDQTLKYIILPFSLGTSFPVLITKYRESSSKSKGQAYFDRACQRISQDEQIDCLRKAMYYGGGMMRGMILMSPQFQGHIPRLKITYHPQAKIRWRMRPVRLPKGIVRLSTRAVLKFFTGVCSFVLEVRKEWQKAMKEIRDSYHNEPIKPRFWWKLLLPFGILAVGMTIVWLGGRFHVYSWVGDFYRSLFGNDPIRANASLAPLYFGGVCLYLSHRHFSKSSRTEGQVTLLSLAGNMLLFLCSVLIVFFTDFVDRSWFSLLLVPCMFHFTWFLNVLTVTVPKG